jgi:hypothetical protein
MYYRRMAYNTCGTLTSNSAQVTVHPQFTQSNPTATTICYNTTTTLSLAAASGGTGAIAYQWQQSANNSTWTNATGTGTNAAYTTSALTASMYYRRIAYNTCGTLTSNSAQVTVRPAFTPGTITTGSSTICYGVAGVNIASSVTASGGNNTITYEWRRNGTAIDGTNANNYTPPAAANTATGTFTFTRWAKDGACSTTLVQSAGSYVLMVRAAFNPGSIQTKTVYFPQGVALDGNAATSVTQSGGDGNTTQNQWRWRLNTGGWTSTGTFGGATYALSGINRTVTQTGTYTVTKQVKDGGTCQSAWVDAAGTVTVVILTPPSGANTYVTCTNRMVMSSPIRLNASPSCGDCTNDNWSYYCTETFVVNNPIGMWAVFTDDGDDGYKYSTMCAKKSATLLCPSPWKLPDSAQFMQFMNQCYSLDWPTWQTTSQPGWLRDPGQINNWENRDQRNTWLNGGTIPYGGCHSSGCWTNDGTEGRGQYSALDVRCVLNY